MNFLKGFTDISRIKVPPNVSWLKRTVYWNTYKTYCIPVAFFSVLILCQAPHRSQYLLIFLQCYMFVPAHSLCISCSYFLECPFPRMAPYYPLGVSTLTTSSERPSLTILTQSNDTLSFHHIPLL